MDRRDFFKTAAGVSLYSTIGIITSSKTARAFFIETEETPYDLVAVRGGEPAAMADAALAALGGMSAFVTKGQTVVVKPNIGWDVEPERAANTNPKLVARIIEQCFNAGAKSVTVFDNTCDQWQKCYRNSGIERAARDAGAVVAPAHTEGYFQDVSVAGGMVLKKAKVHEAILETDVFINVPVLKHHGSARITVTMKNLMGIVWDRRYWHRNDLQQCIADFAGYRKPDLNIVDAYAVMKENGPRGVSAGDLVVMKSLLASRDMVTADTAGAKLFGVEPSEVRHIRLATEAKVGRGDLENLRIKRIAL